MKPDHFLGVAGETAARTIAAVIEKTDEILALEKPDAILFYGDTNTCLGVIAAKRRKIPVFHMEAGNRCFDQRVPEELNRKVIDHLSDINMVLTEHARRYLISEGIRPENIIKTGSHMHEVLAHYMPKIATSAVLSRLGLEEAKYFLVSFHREENVDSLESLQEFSHTLNCLAQEYSLPIVVSTHPRTRKRLDALEHTKFDSLIQFSKPFGFIDYIKLQTQALCVLSDSGTLTEEASLLNLPAITIRNSHERPEGMDVGTLIMSGLGRDRVLDSVKVTLAQRGASGPAIRSVPDYESGPVSKQVLRILLSYTDYVNRVVWQKY